MASKIWAPQYDGIVEIPILDSVLRSPLPSPLTARACAWSFVMSSGSQPELDELGQRLEHQVRVDGRGAVADQGRDAVDAAGLARLDDEAGLEARALAHEVMVHRCRREERRHGGPLGADGAVGEDQDVGAGRERLVGLAAEAVERDVHPRRPLLDGPRHVERARLEDRRVHLAQLLELGVEQDRRLQHELARVLGRLVEEVLLGADARLQAHHDRLADRVDRRVRHLREQLLEVRVDEPVAVGEDREGRVVAHRADRLLGVARERGQDHLHVLERVAERDLPLAQGLGRHRVRHPGRQVGEPHDLAVEPLAVRLLGGDPALDLVVGDDPSLLEIDEEELARAAAGPCGGCSTAGMSSTPASEASTTQPSRVSSQRPGRRPLRSSVEPITRPSVNDTAAGPSQASIRHWW